MTVPRYAREIPQRYRLEAARCTGCGHLSFPPRQVCPKCRETAMETQTLAREGKVVTWTVIHTPPDDFALQAPYVLAVVELDDGVRITTQITDCDPDSIQAGTRVRHTFRRINADGADGVLMYGYKFLPA